MALNSGIVQVKYGRFGGSYAFPGFSATPAPSALLSTSGGHYGLQYSSGILQCRFKRYLLPADPIVGLKAGKYYTLVSAGRVANAGGTSISKHSERGHRATAIMIGSSGVGVAPSFGVMSLVLLLAKAVFSPATVSQFLWTRWMNLSEIRLSSAELEL